MKRTDHHPPDESAAMRLFNSDQYDLQVLHLLYREMCDGRDRFGRFASLHEAHSVLLEEVTEYAEAIRKREPAKEAALEALQVGAVALRIVIEFGGDPLAGELLGDWHRLVSRKEARPSERAGEAYGGVPPLERKTDAAASDC